jgi:hypothetical protein
LPLSSLLCEGRPRWPCACQWRNGLGRREPASHCPATARRPRPGLRLCRGGDVTVPSLNPPERPQARGEPRVAKTAHFKLAATGTRSRRPLSAPVPVTCTRPPALGPRAGPASPRGPRRAPGPASRIGRLELAKDTPIIWNRRQPVGHDRALRRSNETGPSAEFAGTTGSRSEVLSSRFTLRQVPVEVDAPRTRLP